MIPIFEETDGNYEGSMYISLGNTAVKFHVTKSAVPGYIFTHLNQFDGDPPFTAAQKAYTSLWYGNQHPTLILSSEAMMKRMVFRLRENERKPAMHGVNFAFHFMDALWTHPENMGFEIEDGWVFMLNTNQPLNFKLNGCYKPMEGS